MGRSFFLFLFCLVRYYPAIPLFLSLFALLYIPWVCSIVGERGAFYKKMRWKKRWNGEKEGRQATKQTKETILYWMFLDDDDGNSISVSLESRRFFQIRYKQ